MSFSLSFTSLLQVQPSPVPIAARPQEGAQGNPPPARGCGGAGAGLSFLTACCHLVTEGPGHRGPRLRTLGRDLRPAGWSSGFCCALDAPQERLGGARRRGATEGVCAAGPRLPRGPDTPGCGKKICLWRCPGYLCRDRAGPCPGSSTLLVLIQESVSVSGGVEGESPADFCQCAASSGPSPQILENICLYIPLRGHLERDSCPLLCLQFPSSCLVSVNHPMKANTAGKD